MMTHRRMIPRFLTLALTLALALIGLAILGRTPAWAQQWPVNGDFRYSLFRDAGSDCSAGVISRTTW